MLHTDICRADGDHTGPCSMYQDVYDDCANGCVDPEGHREEPDPVNTPAHYTFSGVEPLDAIEAWDLNFSRGCVVKYVARAKHKGTELLDLQKAAFYLAREIANLEKEVMPS